MYATLTRSQPFGNGGNSNRKGVALHDTGRFNISKTGR
jgi:hypothetical protein